MDLIVKYLNDVPFGQVLFMRFFFGMIPIFFLIPRDKIFTFYKTKRPILHTFRAISGTIAIIALFVALRNLPLADVISLTFTGPLFVTIMSVIFLSEKVGIRRWSAIVVGFIGVIIVLDPTWGEFDYFKLSPVACAICYSCSMTITKYTSDKDSIYTQMTWLYIFATFAGLMIFLITGDGKFNTFTDPTMQFIVREWFTNPSASWPYVLVMGIVASISFFCVFSAYSIASPSIVSLFEYSYIVWAMLAGYILFETIPVPRTFLGAAIIIAAGFYIYFREKVRGQMIATDTPNR